MSDNTIYILKVALDFQRDIWRRIAIRGDQTLEDLQYAINAAFDRDNDHLYAFYISKPGAHVRSQMLRRSIRYLPPRAIDSYLARLGEEKDAETTTIASLQLVRRQLFRYLFDFGDEWWHAITVENMNAEFDPTLHYPVIIEKHGESPAQYEEYEEEA